MTFLWCTHHLFVFVKRSFQIVTECWRFELVNTYRYQSVLQPPPADWEPLCLWVFTFSSTLSWPQQDLILQILRGFVCPDSEVLPASWPVILHTFLQDDATSNVPDGHFLFQFSQNVGKSILSKITHQCASLQDTVTNFFDQRFGENVGHSNKYSKTLRALQWQSMARIALLPFLCYLDSTESRRWVRRKAHSGWI